MASEADLFPTILDYVILPTPSPVDGISMRPIIEGKPGAKGHAHVFAGVGGLPPGDRRGMEERSVLDGRWHIITRTRLDEPRMIQADSRDFDVWRNRTYRETVRTKDRFPEACRILGEFDSDRLGGKPAAFELYDLQTGRDEMHNLAYAPPIVENWSDSSPP